MSGIVRLRIREIAEIISDTNVPNDKSKGAVERRTSAGLATFEAFKNQAGKHTFVLTDEQVKATQKVIWESAQDVIGVCEKHGIPYFVDGGTCLGAIRHRGFIPWDDDIDIALARGDYERFITRFEEEHGERYWIHELGKTSEYSLPIVQIRRKGTVFRGRDDFGSKENGVPIDLYVIENVFDNRFLRLLQGFLCNSAQFLLSCRKFATYLDYYLWFADGVEAAEKGAKRKAAIGRILGFVPLQSAEQLVNWAFTLCHNNHSEWVSIPSGWEHFFGGLNKRNALLPPAKAVFESREVSVPCDYDKYLTGLYGKNYMDLPPESKREKHTLAEFDLGVVG